MDLSNYILLEGETGPELSFEATADDNGRTFVLKASNQYGEKFSREAYLGTHEDAADYFSRVEALGGVVDNKRAINRFFESLDKYGLRQYIREAYLLCGVSFEGLPAKLIHENGVTDELVLNNFVTGDYKRKGLLAGLKGNGSSYIDTYFTLTTNTYRSLAAFVTDDPDVSPFGAYVGAVDGSRSVLTKRDSRIEFRLSTAGASVTSYVSVSVPKFIHGRGILIEEDRSRELFINGVLVDQNTNDSAPSTSTAWPARVFGTSNLSTGDPTNLSTSRISIAMIMTGLAANDPVPPVPLNYVVQQLMLDLGVIELHPDTLNYIQRVETEDGQALEPVIVEAWDVFFRAMDDPAHPTPTAATHKIALAEGTMIPMFGARTLAGALIPAYPGMPTPTNVGFVTGDYGRAEGLTGNGTDKHIRTGVYDDSLPLDDISLGAVQYDPHTAGQAVIIGVSTDQPGGITYSSMQTSSAGSERINFRCRNQALQAEDGVNVPGFAGVSRDSNTEFQFRAAGTAYSKSQGSSSNVSLEFSVFAYIDGIGSRNNSRATLFCPFVGTAIDLAYMDSCITQLQSSIAAALE